MEFGPRDQGRMLVSLAVLVILASLAWWTMEAGRFRSVTLVLLGFFAARIVLARAGSR